MRFLFAWRVVMSHFLLKPINCPSWVFRACWISIEPLPDNAFKHFKNDQVQAYGIWRLKIHALC
jgi:hypothetical protein